MSLWDIRFGPSEPTPEQSQRRVNRITKFLLESLPPEKTTMSWSVSAVGKPAAVAAKIAKDIANVKCMEPEETIKASAGSIVATALAAFPEDYAVKVEAGGSQSSSYGADGKAIPEKWVNSLTVKIEPLWGFVS